MSIKKCMLPIFAAALLFTGACSNKSAGPTYTNPVFEPVIADPAIIKAEDGNYYVYGTEDDWGDGTGAKYIPIIKSQNLTDWEYAGDAFESVEKPDWKPGGLWAPDIEFFQGKYYLYYSLSTWGDYNPGIGVAASDSPEGPFQDHGKIFQSAEIGVDNSIDPFFIEDGGIPYLFWGSFHGIYGVELTQDGMQVKGEPFQIAGNAYEAPYIIKRDGFYYFFGSLGSCCEGADSTYRVSAARSESINGPYVDHQGVDILISEGWPVLLGSEKFAGPGHNAIFTDDAGKDWIIYHGIDKNDPKLENGASRRPLMIDPLVWKDGWPSVKNLAPSEKKQKAPMIKHE